MPALAPDPARPSPTTQPDDDDDRLLADRAAPDRLLADRAGRIGIGGAGGPGGATLDGGAADGRADDDRSPDPATVRLRALLAPGDPWGDRLAVGPRLAEAVAAVGVRRVVIVVVAAVMLGLGAHLVVGAGGGPSIDPVQVLPRVDPVTPGGSGPGPGPGSGAPAPAGPTAPAAPGPGGVATGGVGTSIPPAVPATIQVHAAGAVVVAGVHPLADGSRVADLIRAAGGLAPDADPDRINLAAPVRDGERVYVPRTGEADAPVVVAGGGDGSGGGAAAEPGGDRSSGPPATGVETVDINAADAEALDRLPGVGPATADAIIRHRTANGPFRTVEDLQEVPGIGPAKLDRLRDLVRIG